MTKHTAQAVLESYGFKLVTGAAFDAATDKPAGLAERAAKYRDGASHVIYDPADDEDGYMIWAGDPVAMATETVADKELDLFNRHNLSPMVAARLETCLAKLFRYDDGVRSLGAEIEARAGRGEIFAKKATDGMIDYSRTKFNRMNGREQAAYEARLKAKRYYWLECSDGTGMSVPKTVFDAIALPLADRSL